MSSLEVRNDLVDVLTLDLIGPGNDHARLAREVLDEPPSRRYLSGFLAPKVSGDKVEPAGDELVAEEVDSDPKENAIRATDDNNAKEGTAARKAFFSTSMGLSFFVRPDAKSVKVVVRWGDYQSEVPMPKSVEDQEHGLKTGNWTREPKERVIDIALPAKTGTPIVTPVPDSNGLILHLTVKPVPNHPNLADLIPTGTRAVALFLVNEREPVTVRSFRDLAFIFQAELEVQSELPFVPRPDPRGYGSEEPDDRIADLQYRDIADYAVGHGIATKAIEVGGECKALKTTWIPDADVEVVKPSEITDVEFGMEALAALPDGAAAADKLQPMVEQYRNWILGQRTGYGTVPKRRKEVAEALLDRANAVAKRIESGIVVLRDQPMAWTAFKLANKAMAASARQRQGFSATPPKKPADVAPPTWRPFQLAFLLMTLRGVVEPTHQERKSVDLLFFPTGGGKTEAYLGLAAFTLFYRRLKDPSISSAGLSVLMRYTLRLLTLDQLGRASTLICAMEIERLADVNALGKWPFEIGLWVGSGATPNRMGTKASDDQYSARHKVLRYKKNPLFGTPIPLSHCPWCGTPLGPDSFNLVPNVDTPTDLRVTCADPNCAFTRGRALPVLAVDEPIYRRLPCFMIATVDKFAAMPWTGEVAGFFGKADRYDAQGFYGPSQPGQGSPLPAKLPPPDLIIQDELHLISGPMGSMVGLYEAALDELCTRTIDGKQVRPKIVASTATVRRAEKQIKALFNRHEVEVFPAPGPNRSRTFFSETVPIDQQAGRKYVGIAAQGRSPKVILLKTYLALLSASQKAWNADGGSKNSNNAADPYMTLVGYFNSLRELGGSRRIVEDEVASKLEKYSGRRRVGEADKDVPFADRAIRIYTDAVVELTSRVSTGEVTKAKAKLAESFGAKDGQTVDVALATNMISVGLDISRLGLMAVFGQPKTASEYIQATSRVGRQASKPGLVTTLFNIHRVRDRSHYEQFTHFHRTFYRQVEAFSVTPFSPRALDRGLPGALLGLARLGVPAMSPAAGAADIDANRKAVEDLAQSLIQRAADTADPSDAKELADNLKRRIGELLDEWSSIAAVYSKESVGLQYQGEIPGTKHKPLMFDFLNPELKKNPMHVKFRAGRSMRDVEPSVNLWVLNSDRSDVEGSADV